MFWWVVDGFDGMNMEWFWSSGWLPHRTNVMFVGVYKPYLLTKKQHHKDSNSTISCLNKLRQHFGAPHCGTCSVQVLYFLWSTPCHSHPDKQRVSKGNGQFPSIRRWSTNVGCFIAIVLYQEASRLKAVTVNIAVLRHGQVWTHRMNWRFQHLCHGQSTWD